MSGQRLGSFPAGRFYRRLWGPDYHCPSLPLRCPSRCQSRVCHAAQTVDTVSKIYTVSALPWFLVTRNHGYIQGTSVWLACTSFPKLNLTSSIWHCQKELHEYYVKQWEQAIFISQEVRLIVVDISATHGSQRSSRLRNRSFPIH